MQLQSSFNTLPLPEFAQASLADRVESLRSVAMLLLKEVESLQETATRETADFSTGGFSLADQLEQYEKDMIRCALIRANGRQNRAASLLGVKITTLNAKIKKYGIDWRGMDIQSAEGLQ